MNQVLYPVFFACTILVTAVHGQNHPGCPPGAPAAADNCEDVCVVCDFSILSGNNTGYSTSPANGFCGTPVMDLWYGFMAGEQFAVFEVTPSNCNFGDGLQVALYDDCSGDPLVCEAGGAGLGNVPLQLSSILTPGKFYYLRINGYNGDGCDFDVTVTPTSAVQPLVPGQPGPIIGPAQVCPGGAFEYRIPAPVTHATAYRWTAPAGWLINGQPGPVEVSGAQNLDVQITPGATSGQVCVQAVNPCEAGPIVCHSVIVQPIPPTTLPSVILCNESVPYFLPWGDVAFTSGLYSTVLFSASGCDSVVLQQVIVRPPIITNMGNVRACGGACESVCDELFCDSGVYTRVCTSWLGCDSIVNFSIVPLLPPDRGAVYRDLNANGVRDTGEPALSGVEVRTSSGQSDFTDFEGIYTFTTLNDGDTLFLPNPPNGSATQPAFHIYSSAQTSCYGFGVLPPPGNALGQVFFDLNGDGVFNAGDQPAPNAIVQSGTTTATINNQGYYQFTNLQQGDTITLILPPNASGVSPAFHIYQNSQVNNYNFALTPGAGPATGFVFYDYDGNGIRTIGEPLAPGIQVVTSSGAMVVTNPQGGYTLPTVFPSDTIRVVEQFPGQGSYPAFRLYQPFTTFSYFFGIDPPAGLVDVSVHANQSGPFRPGFENFILVSVRNHLDVAGGVQLRLLIPAFLEVLEVDPMQSFFSGDTLVWNIGAMQPDEALSFKLKVRTPVNTALGTVVPVQSWVTISGSDFQVSNNYGSFQGVVVGSFDPNDKQVQPAYMQPSLAAQRPPFEYTIRFQNTGNYPADFVIIRDTLSEDLDLASFRILDASHAFEWSILPGRILEVVFPGINLPDSLSNEPESHGFVRFSIRPAKVFALGYRIENVANIFFDYNDPIRTNVVGTQVVYFIPGNGFPSPNDAISLRPNPASWQLRISWAQPAEPGNQIRVFNLFGLPELEEEVATGATSAALNISYLEQGVYLMVYETPTATLRKTFVVARSGPVRRE